MTNRAGAIARDPYLAVVAVVVAERLLELQVSRRHVRLALERGGVEHGRRHYPLLVAAHVGLLAGCAAERVARRAARGSPSQSSDSAVHPLMLIGVITAQALRWWSIASLGESWSTRIVTVPGRPLVRRGPYRMLRHPNYAAVVLEGIALPMAGGCRTSASIFTVANAVLLAARIRAEDRALGR